MLYELEQGIYFISCRKFEATDGLGINAASRSDAEALQAMRFVAARTNFYESGTQYSFLYTPELGFCTAATTICDPDGRATPYIHMAFSRRHPANPPREYAFDVRFQTAPSAPGGELPVLRAARLPDWEPFRGLVSASQLAWLIQRLWGLLAVPGVGGEALVLSSSGILPGSDALPRLTQVMRKLAELVPAAFRKNLCGTTAPLSSSNRQFNVLFSNAPDALRFDRLPELELEKGDYFGALCLKMAESYLERTEEFQSLCALIEQKALSVVKGKSIQNLALAACCVTAVPQSPWSIQNGTLIAAYDRVSSLLRNDYVNLSFWEEQERNFRRIVPPKELPELLRWLQEHSKPREDWAALLYSCYQMAPDPFLEQLLQVEQRDRPHLVCLWEYPDFSGGLERRLFAGEAGTFYTRLSRQLDFWTFPEAVSVGRPGEYFSKWLSQAPQASLETLCRLFEAPQGLLTDQALLTQLERSIESEKGLPPLRLLQKLPRQLSGAPALKNTLAERWREAEQRIETREQRREWRQIGDLLGVFDAKQEEKRIDELIENIQTAQDAVNLVNTSSLSLTLLQEGGFKRKIQALIRASSGSRELEELLKLCQSLPGYWSHPDWEYEIKKKLETARLEEAISRGSLKEMLKMTADPEQEFILRTSSDQRRLWLDRVKQALDSEDCQTQLCWEDRKLVMESAQWIKRWDSDAAARGLCRRFFDVSRPTLDMLETDGTPARRPYLYAWMDWLQELAKGASLRRLCEFMEVNMDCDLRCPPEAWNELTKEDQLRILSQESLSGAMEKLLVPEQPFCDLLLCLYRPYRKYGHMESKTTDALWTCLADAIQRLPESKKIAERLLHCLSESKTSPTAAQCRALVARVQSLGPLDRKTWKQAFKLWKKAFEKTSYTKLLSEAYSGQTGKGAIQRGADGTASVAGDELPEAAGVEDKNGGRSRKRFGELLRALKKTDQLIEKIFVLCSYPIRFPILLLIWALENLAPRP